jgi:molecular chaperone DnaJ
VRRVRAGLTVPGVFHRADHLPRLPRQAGQGRVTKRVSVKIPGGVDNGSRLRLTGEGEPGQHGGPPGDLYVFIQVQPHEFFERRDNDVVCQVTIAFVQAALGDTIAVPTLEGSHNLEIPKGTQPGDVFYFHGEGIPSLRNRKRGDQVIQVMIKTPTNLSRKQEELLREFAKLEKGKFSNKLKHILKGDSSSAAQ